MIELGIIFLALAVFATAFFRWIIRPHVDDKRTLMRCRHCGTLFWDGEKGLRQHLGHMFSPATNGTVWEAIKIKLGMIK